MSQGDGGCFDEAGEVHVEQGLVVVDGPDGIAVTLTARAAREFGHRLIDAAEQIIVTS